MTNAKQMEQALRLIAYSAHSGLPRFGIKAEIARWGLNEGPMPKLPLRDDTGVDKCVKKQ